MADAIVLDTGVLGVVVHRSGNSEQAACRSWLEALIQRGLPVYVPEIADYELRRKLLHLDFSQSILRLDQLKDSVEYAPLSTTAMLKAAGFWADARKKGIVTAPPEAIDGDVILAAQASLIAATGGRHPVVATTNVGHLSHFMDARVWRDIDPAALSPI